MLVIYWKSGDPEGYSDLLPSSWLETEGEWPICSHDVQGPKGGRYTARCSLRVQGNILDLDYGGDHAAYNQSSFEIGILRLIFSDSARNDLVEVQWREHETNASFEKQDVDWRILDIALEGLETFDPLDIEDGRRRIERMVVLRQGQSGFRRALMDAYGRQCSVTGCQIEDVLEAAHISPYLGDQTNHVTNGLLLRADIHTLFDRGLIKVDREYRISAPAYILAAYDEDIREMIMLPLDSALHPNRDALDIKYQIGRDVMA